MANWKKNSDGEIFKDLHNNLWTNGIYRTYDHLLRIWIVNNILSYGGGTLASKTNAENASNSVCEPIN